MEAESSQLLQERLLITLFLHCLAQSPYHTTIKDYRDRINNVIIYYHCYLHSIESNYFHKYKKFVCIIHQNILNYKSELS
jgi:hypothetical protein